MGLKALAEATHLSEVRVAYRPGIEGDIVGAGAWNIFTVAGGAVEVKMMFGRVTVAIVGAALPRIQFTPTITGALVPLCAAAATINGDAIDTVYYWAGTLAGVLTPSVSLGVIGTAEAAWAGNTLLLPPGVMSITNAGPVATGVIDWYVAYVPCMVGAEVTPL